MVGWADIPGNYSDYCNYIRSRPRAGSADPALVYLLAAQYGDADANLPGWLMALACDDLSVWEQNLDHYRKYFQAVDFCTISANGEPATVAPPAWWDPGTAQREHREHFVNNGVLAEAAATGKTWTQVLAEVIALADNRGADTIWITETSSSAHGSVYGFLPPYWNELVALCTPASPPSTHRAVDVKT